MNENITIVTVPSEAGTHWGGQANAPNALLSAGLSIKLHTKDISNSIVSALQTPHLWTPHPLLNGVRNEQGVLDVMRDVRDTLSPIFTQDTIPLILGGDCSITPAVFSALSNSSSKKVGLLCFDGDLDLSLPAINGQMDSDTGVLDSMVFSHLTNRDGGLLSIQKFLHPTPGKDPLVTADNIVVFGFDPLQPKPEHLVYLLERQYKAISAPSVRNNPAAAAIEALEWLEARCEGILVHFDLDAVSSDLFPLGNYPHYAGLAFEEAMTCLGVFIGSRKLSGVVVTEVNPGNDPGGILVERLVEGIVGAFGRRGKLNEENLDCERNIVKMK